MNRFVTGLIVANTAVLAAGNLEPAWEHRLAPVETLFLAAFTLEIGWRWWRREHSRWLWFDTLIIILAVLPAVGATVTIARVARLARAAHVGRHLTGLRLADFLRIKPLPSAR